MRTPLPLPAAQSVAGRAGLRVDVLSAVPLVVGVSGEIDIASGRQLREELFHVTKQHGARLALDLGGVTFIDCAGIGVLLALRNRIQLQGGWVRIVRVSRCTRTIIMLLGLHREFASASP